jgi:hypothetical protein
MAAEGRCVESTYNGEPSNKQPPVFVLSIVCLQNCPPKLASSSNPCVASCSRPEVHLHYPESVFPMKDGLPKYSQWFESEKVEEGA